MSRVLGQVKMKPGIWKVRVIADTGNTKKQPIMASLTNPSNQPSLEISPIWIALISQDFAIDQVRS